MFGANVHGYSHSFFIDTTTAKSDLTPVLWDLKFSDIEMMNWLYLQVHFYTYFYSHLPFFHKIPFSQILSYFVDDCTFPCEIIRSFCLETAWLLRMKWFRAFLRIVNIENKHVLMSINSHLILFISTHLDTNIRWFCIYNALFWSSKFLHEIAYWILPFNSM